MKNKELIILLILISNVIFGQEIEKYPIGHSVIVRNNVVEGKVLKISYFKLKIEIIQQLKGNLTKKKIKVWYNFNAWERYGDIDLVVGDTCMFIIGGKNTFQRKMTLRKRNWFKINHDEIFISGEYFMRLRTDGSDKSKKLKESLINVGYTFSKKEFVYYINLLNKSFTKDEIRNCYHYSQIGGELNSFHKLLMYDLISQKSCE